MRMKALPQTSTQNCPVLLSSSVDSMDWSRLVVLMTENTGCIASISPVVTTIIMACSVVPSHHQVLQTVQFPIPS